MNEKSFDNVDKAAALKNVNIKSNGKKSVLGNEYSEILSNIKKPLKCVICLTSTNSPSHITGSLAISDKKESIAFLDKNGAYNYRTITHEISSEGFSFGLVCARDGSVELYRLGQDGEELSSFVAKTKLGKELADPMFAIAFDGAVYIVMNIPTKAAAAAGHAVRKPLLSQDQGWPMAIASGTPAIVKFDTIAEEATITVEPVEKIQRYVAGIIEDQLGGLPFLMIANIITTDEEEKKPSFRSMMSKIIENRGIAKSEHELPLGVSVAKMNDNGYEYVPMSGNAEYGIASVVLEESEDDNNSLCFCVSEKNINQNMM